MKKQFLFLLLLGLLCSIGNAWGTATNYHVFKTSGDTIIDVEGTGSTPTAKFTAVNNTDWAQVSTSSKNNSIYRLDPSTGVVASSKSNTYGTKLGSSVYSIYKVTGVSAVIFYIGTGTAERSGYLDVVSSDESVNVEKAVTTVCSDKNNAYTMSYALDPVKSYTLTAYASADIFCYAVKFTVAPKGYAITLDRNGGTADGSGSIPANATSFSPSAPTYAGHTVDGYYTTSACNAEDLIATAAGALQPSITVSEVAWTNSSSQWVKGGAAKFYAHWKVNTPEISCVNNEVTITVPSGSTVYYTDDESTPTNESSAYSAPFTITATKTIKAIAIQDGCTSSEVAAEECELVTPKCVTPSISPANGSTFSTATQSVTISCETTGTAIYYTLDGTAPTTSSTPYNGAFTISSTKTVKAMATRAGYDNSDIASSTITKKLPKVIYSLLDAVGSAAVEADNASVSSTSLVLSNNSGRIKLSSASGKFKNGDIVTISGSVGNNSKKFGIDYGPTTSVGTKIDVDGTNCNASGTLSLASDADNLYLKRADGTTTTITYMVIGRLTEVTAESFNGVKIDHATATLSTDYTVAGNTITLVNSFISAPVVDLKNNVTFSDESTSNVDMNVSFGDAEGGFFTGSTTINEVVYTVKVPVTPTYAITKGTHDNGDFTIDPTSQAEGETVTLTAAPNEDYLFSAWEVVKTEDGTDAGVTVTNNKFTMPEFAVTVNATFVTDPRDKILYLTTTSAADTKANDKLYDALKDDYNIKIEAPNSQTLTNYDLIVLHESIGGTNTNAAVTGCKTTTVPVLNTKSYFYNNANTNDRWGWGTPNAGTSVKGCTPNAAYSNIASHPIFAGVITDGFVEITDEAAAKCMQPIGAFTTGKEGYTLATSPNESEGNGCAIHELTPAQRGATSGKYLMISVSSAKLNALNANGQKLFQNAVAYLLDGSASWTPVTTTATINATYGWATLSSEYPLDFTDTDVEAYIVTGVTGSVLDKTRVYKVPANTGLLITGTTDNIPANLGSADALVDFSADKMIPGTGVEFVKAAGFDEYILSVENNKAVFKLIDTDLPTVPKGNAFLQLASGSVSAPSIIRLEDEENNATNIYNLDASENAVKFIENGVLYILRDGVVYDALGRVIRK